MHIRKPIAISSPLATVVVCDDGTVWMAQIHPQNTETIRWIQLPPIPQLTVVPPTVIERETCTSTYIYHSEIMSCTRPAGHAGECV